MPLPEVPRGRRHAGFPAPRLAACRVTLWACCLGVSGLFVCSPVDAADSRQGAESRRPQPIQSTLQRAKSLIDSHQEEKASELLQEFIARYQGSEFLDDAYLLMAAAMLGQEQPEAAASYLNQLLTEMPTSPLVDRARLTLGRAHADMGDLDTALSVLAEARSFTVNPETKRESLKASGDLLVKRGDYVKALRTWLEELSYSSPEQREKVQERINSLVLTKLTLDDLRKVRDSYPEQYPGDLALIRLIEGYTARGEEHQAERNIRLFLTRFPSHEYSATAWNILRSFRAKLKASDYVLGAVLPLSGPLAAFGAEALNGIRLALDKARTTLGLARIGLAIKDTVTDKAVLKAELADLVQADRPLAVIGPLLSRHLPTVAGLAAQSETPFITPAATLSDVQRVGTYLFSTAFTQPQQASRLADYAMERLGYQRFCVLHPDTSYGRELARRFVRAIQLRGGEIIAVETYQEQDADFGPQIRRLKARDLEQQGTETRTILENGKVQVTYTPGFDAVFLPGHSSQIPLIAAQLAFYDMTVPLLGSNSWNSPTLLRLGDRSLDGSVFLDGFFQQSPDPAVREFVERYRHRYQSSPSIFAAQAYDAAWLVLNAIHNGVTTGRQLREQLLGIHDLPTLGGPAAFDPGGGLSRKVFVIQVKDGKMQQVN